MWIARVVGTVVATRKPESFRGRKLLLVQPLDPRGASRGEPLLAIDAGDAGVGERVLVTVEGRAAREALGDPGSPADAAIVGTIDRVDLFPGRAGSEDR